MKQVVSWLQNIFIRVVVTFSLVAITFLLNISLGYGNPMEAQAATLLTIDSSSYTVDRNAAAHPEKDAIGNTQEQLKSTADNVREKLNLDQPIAPSTKKFFRQVEDKTEEIFGGGQSHSEQNDRANANRNR